jgi:hypothetical protein
MKIGAIKMHLSIFFLQNLSFFPAFRHQKEIKHSNYVETSTRLHRCLDEELHP